MIGADPGVTLAAVTPVPDTMSEYQFAGLLRGKRVELVDCVTVPIKVPATAEIVIEGHVSLDELGDEGPYGDHTGYYNAVEPFPVFTVSAITMRRDPIYLSTFTGRPPDEPSVLGEALNDVFVPLLRQQFPEIVDFWLPPEGCSYRVAVVSIRKAYPGHARRIMMGVWSYLRQFMYTKFVIVVDDDIDCRDWKDVIWAISTRVDPGRDLMVVEHTPIDYLDFASPGIRPRRQAGHRRHRQVAAGDEARVGQEAADGGRGGGEGNEQVGSLWPAGQRYADLALADADCSNFGRQSHSTQISPTVGPRFDRQARMLDSIANLISAIARLAWPIIALTLIIMFRHNVRGLFSRVYRASFLGSEFEFEREQLKDNIEKIEALHTTIKSTKPSSGEYRQHCHRRTDRRSE